MAKKIKNMKLEQEELKPITIGIFESRKKNSIGVFLILAIFIGVVTFLPEISEYINGYINPNLNPSTGMKPKPNPNNPGGNIDNNPDEEFYSLNETLKIVRSDITVSDFVVDSTNKTITYNITNNADTYQDIEKLNYFLEIYNSEKALVERVKLSRNKGIASGAFEPVTSNISIEASTNINLLRLVKKNVGDYPPVNLNADEDGSATLICSSEHEKVTYKFTKDKLKELASNTTYKSTDLNYATIHDSYKILTNDYNSKKGISSTIFESIDGFNINTNINLEETERTYIFNADTFSLDTEPKVVKFEMETQGFSCN